MSVVAASHPVVRTPTPSNGKWYALAATFLGECFDALDVSIYFIALYPALSELLHTHDATAIGWHGAFILSIFMVGWSAGSALLGYTSDRWGRVRTLTASIILYAVATGLCATCHSWQELAIYRFFVGLGIGGEMSVGTVLLGEYWYGQSRAWAMAIMQTSFGVGCIMTGLFNIGTGAFGWRYLFLIGLLPALVAFYIQAKLPETQSINNLKAKKRRVAQKGIALLEGEEKHLFINPFKLAFTSTYRSKTILSLLIMSSAITGYWIAGAWLPAWINQLTGNAAINERSASEMWFGVGCIAGSLATPVLIKFLEYKKSMFIGFLSTLVSTLILFLSVKTYGPAINIGSFIIGFTNCITFLLGSLYMVASFPTYLVGTASGTAWGTGRAMVAVMGLCMGPLIAVFHGSYALTIAMLSPVSLVGLIAAYFVNEPKESIEFENQIVENPQPLLIHD